MLLMVHISLTIYNWMVINTSHLISMPHFTFNCTTFLCTDGKELLFAITRVDNSFCVHSIKLMIIPKSSIASPFIRQAGISHFLLPSSQKLSDDAFGHVQGSFYTSLGGDWATT